MTMPESLATAVERGDVDDLVRLVDALCASREWDRLLELRDRCEQAVARGRQLWPVAAHAEYRLALEAPGRYAATVLVEGAGRFAPGPLPEVAASTHEWAELAPHAPPGPAAVLAAHERVVRGEDLTGQTLPGPPVLDLPLRLAGWEPEYLLAHYRPDGVDLPGPQSPALAPVEVPSRSPDGSHDPATHALLDAVRAWTEGSEGRAEATTVRGDAPRRDHCARTRSSAHGGALSFRSPVHARVGGRERRRARPTTWRGGGAFRRVVGGRGAHRSARRVARRRRNGSATR